MHVFKAFRNLLLFMVSVLFQPTAQADIFSGTIGTKFACCSTTSISCLGGGGGTVYRKFLADRALTQVDAQIRCGTGYLNWGSNECPASVTCPDSPSPRPVPNPAPKPQDGNTYTWDATYEYCYRSPNFALVPNAVCGKQQRILTVKDYYCTVSIDGNTQPLLNRGEADCPAKLENSSYSWENGKYCYQYPGASLVANSFCNQPSRILDIQSPYCSIFVDGQYTGLLSAGEQDCPAQVDTTPAPVTGIGSPSSGSTDGPDATGSVMTYDGSAIIVQRLDAPNALADAGIEVGDRILEVNGQYITSLELYNQLINQASGSTSFLIQQFQGSQVKTVYVNFVGM